MRGSNKTEIEPSTGNRAVINNQLRIEIKPATFQNQIWNSTKTDKASRALAADLEKLNHKQITHFQVEPIS